MGIFIVQGKKLFLEVRANNPNEYPKQEMNLFCQSEFLLSLFFPENSTGARVRVLVIT